MKRKLSEAEDAFIPVTNDGSEEAIVYLYGLKKVITDQLPNMPRDYIVRVLMDRRHHCLCIVRDRRVVGGICYRPFVSQGFAEIVFLAITETEKHKGYGTKVMNNLKEHVKKSGIHFFLTYADNTAIGYFCKQGFTKRKSMARVRWDGFIKDYVRSTLMECKIIHNVNYLEIKEMLAAQKRALSEKLATISQSHIVRLGIAALGRGETVAVKDIPGVMEAGYDPEKDPGRADASSSMLAPKMGQTIKMMKQAWPFQQPVRADDAPNYYEVIKHPMDLGTMDRKLSQGKYATMEDFVSDFLLIVDNCKVYNDKDTIYVRHAESIQKKFMSLMAHL